VLETDRPEWALAGGERLGGLTANQAAVAGQFSYAALVNLAASGVLVVVEQIRARTAGFVKLLGPTLVAGAVPFLPGELASSFTTFIRDGRLVNRVMTAGSVIGSNVAALSAEATLAALLIEAVYSAPIILPPDTAIAFEGSAANAAAGMDISWREVPLESGLLA